MVGVAARLPAMAETRPRSCTSWSRSRPGSVSQGKPGGGGSLGPRRAAATEGVRGVFLDVAPATFPGLSTGWGSLAAARRRKRPVESSGPGRLRLDGHRSGPSGSNLPNRGPQAHRRCRTGPRRGLARADARKTAERLEALDAAIRGITGVLALDRVLQLIVDRVRDLIGGRIRRARHQQRARHYRALRHERTSVGRSARRSERCRDGRGLLGLIIARGPAGTGSPTSRAPRCSTGSAGHPPMQSFLGVPVRVKGDHRGLLSHEQERGAAEFPRRDQRLVEMFALHAAVAIENARLP